MSSTSSASTGRCSGRPCGSSAQLILLPDVINGFAGDERNALLTLARMVVTAESGQILPKREAAERVRPRLERAEADLLALAREERLGRCRVDWTYENDRALDLLQALRRLVHEAGGVCGAGGSSVSTEQIGLGGLECDADSVGDSSAASEISKRLIVVKAANAASTPAGAAAARSLLKLRLLRTWVPMRWVRLRTRQRPSLWRIWIDQRRCRTKSDGSWRVWMSVNARCCSCFHRRTGATIEA